MLTWAVGVVIARFSFISYLYPLWHLVQHSLKEWVGKNPRTVCQTPTGAIEFQEPIMAATPTEFGPPQIKEPNRKLRSNRSC